MPGGTIYGTTDNQFVEARLDWESTQNIAANTSNVSVRFYLRKLSTSSSGTSGQGSWSVYIEGTAYNTGRASMSLPNNNVWQEVTISPITVNIGHNADGSKSISLSATGGIPNSSYKNTYISGSANLGTIPRTSSFSLTKSSINAGESIGVNISAASGEFWHNVYYTFGGIVNWLVLGGIGGGTSFFTVAISDVQQIPNATSGTANVYVETYHSGTYIGTASAQSFIILVPDGVVPSFPSLTASRVDGTVPPAWGIYVQNKSRAQLTINDAQGAYGSTISSYSISGGGMSIAASSGTTPVLQSSGNITFTGTIRDSRGRTAIRTTLITVVPYSNPSITMSTAERCLVDGTPDTSGTYLKCKCTYVFSSCEGKNSAGATVRYRQLSGSWSTPQAINSAQEIIIGGGNISVLNSYEVQFSVADTFITVVKTNDIPTAKRTMNILPNNSGIAFGKMAEKENTLESAWDMYVMESKVWHEGNDGPGSGLNADMLDGFHAHQLSARYLQNKQYYLETRVVSLPDVAANTSYEFTLDIPSGTFSILPYLGFVKLTDGMHHRISSLFYSGSGYNSTTSARISVNSTSGITAGLYRFSVLLITAS